MDYYNICYGCMEENSVAQVCPHCDYKEGAAPESALHLPPGTVLENKYLLGRALGQGGFGITYLAWDQKLKLKLAIKEYLPQELAYRTPGKSEVSVYKQTLAQHFSYGLNKYLEEARTLARFAGHPGIVWVRDYFEANGTAYIVMEYIEGVTLKEYLASCKKALNFKQALEIFMPVLDALKEVHAEGILHRDISPDNLLISKRGRVVLIDFGAARQAIGEQSRSLSVIMKPGFSPEEQYHSKGKQGPWTDIYAVAASIYCAVTGKIPPESLSRLSEDTLVPPSISGAEIEPLFEKALIKALAVRAIDRYQTVEEFQVALQTGSYEKPVTLSDQNIAGAASPVIPLLEEQRLNLLPQQYSNLKNSAIEMVDLRCPVEVVDYKIEPKGEEGTYANILFRNLGDQTIKAMRFKISCFDSFWEEVSYNGTNIIDKKIQDLKAKPDSIFGDDIRIELKEFADTRNIKLQVINILFDNNSLWHYDDSEVHEVSIDSLAAEEMAELKEVAGDHAVCYARQEKAYWQCVCGRANLLDIDKCQRCKIDRTIVFKNATNREAVAAVLPAKLAAKEAIRVALTAITPKPDYMIDYLNGNIPIGSLPIGTRLVDLSWQWEYRIGGNYTGQAVKKPVAWIIVAIDHYAGLEPHVTLLSEELIGKYAFDESRSMLWSVGKNSWQDSGKGKSAFRSLRLWLNSSGIHANEGFYQAFSDTFKCSVLATDLPNKEWQHGNNYITRDRVFIPTVTELGGKKHVRSYEIGSEYLYFSKGNTKDLIANILNENWWYWTRSPDWDNDKSVSLIDYNGKLSLQLADHPLGGVRPALNLKAGTLVTAIEK